jgi:energy-converting hydrogenase Eha subunit F
MMIAHPKNILDVVQSFCMMMILLLLLSSSSPYYYSREESRAGRIPHKQVGPLRKPPDHT